MRFGFIITRHVNSVKTNLYWNQCVKLIRSYYPFKKIIIIDDNSKQELVKADFNYKNITIIQSEWPGRGELLPYIYYLKYRWFDSAIIIHDSTFIHKRIPFESFVMPVMPFWHHPYDKDNILNSIRVASVLKNNTNILKILSGSETDLLTFNKNGYNLCFGAQCYITLQFLDNIEFKYKISSLVNTIYCRKDRCSFERIIGVIFCEEYSNLIQLKSLFGEIFNVYKALKYTYEEYIIDFNNKVAVAPFVKVWTGRWI